MRFIAAIVFFALIVKFATPIITVLVFIFAAAVVFDILAG